MSDEPIQTQDTPVPNAAKRARRIGGRSATSTAASASAVGVAAATQPAPMQDQEPTSGDVVPTADSTGPTVTLTKELVRGETPRVLGPSERSGRSGPRSIRFAWLAAVLACVLALTALGAGVWGSHRVWWGTGANDVTSDRGAVLAAAKSCTATINTYDYRSMNSSEAKALKCIAPGFAGTYKKAFDQELKPKVTALKAVQSLQVSNAGVNSVSTDGQKWIILVFGQTSITTVTQTTPRLDVFSISVTMQRSGGHWLIAAYEVAPSTQG